MPHVLLHYLLIFLGKFEGKGRNWALFAAGEAALGDWLLITCVAFKEARARKGFARKLAVNTRVDSKTGRKKIRKIEKQNLQGVRWAIVVRPGAGVGAIVWTV